MDLHPALAVFFEKLRNMCECGHWENLNLLLKFLCMILWFDRGVRVEKSLKERTNLVTADSWPPGVLQALILLLWNPLPYFFCLKVPRGHNPSWMSKDVSSTWSNIKERIQTAEMAFLMWCMLQLFTAGWWICCFPTRETPQTEAPWDTLGPGWGTKGDTNSFHLCKHSVVSDAVLVHSPGGCTAGKREFVSQLYLDLSLVSRNSIPHSCRIM